MPRDVDKAALHATLDLLLRTLPAPAPKGALAAPASPDGAPRDALVEAYQGAKAQLRDLATKDPLDALAGVIGAGTVLFYLAEKGKNDKCNTIWDALTFITTCLSVGYDDVFARTSAGKAVASFVMTVGPSFSSRAFDPTRAESDRAEAEAAAAQRAVIERLDAILDELRRASPRTPPPAP